MMNTNKNSYTIIYAAVLVIVVAATLAFISGVLKAPQAKNIEIEKKLNILMSVNKANNQDDAKNKNEYIENEYKKYIDEQFLVNIKGERIEGDAFNTDLKQELEKSENDRRLPVFVCNDNGNKLYVFPVYGPGLWGPIWGYISLKNDFNTIFGAVFDHKGETPGLGAEIVTLKFRERFTNKKLYNNEQFVSVKVIKAGSAPTDVHSVDGVSGGTITSKAVSTLLFNSMENYKAFFTKQKQALSTQN
ncbi:MAG: NADH:ubiquinone reductase (Na(+)-transporting) subunit C [Prevotellaceae bacterium]|jgi:Na+-transporting NADH:ubiquinone oxidoreductase subunit C|nr:NADH:ubiquinone reductase (Na(+)-transporting) subunit C [Prevotellaceae bacterium]